MALVTAAILFLIPDIAAAWGPVAHLSFAIQILSGAIGLSPSILSLITARRGDFIHGNLAADGIVGKNRARDHDHCHNWDVARRLLELAVQEGEARHAMMLGYMAHLGADVVAHNHIVPRMLIKYFARKGVGHLYWEARADERFLSLDPNLRIEWKKLSASRFPDHDRFLARQLVPTVFSNKVSASLWKGGLLMQRNWPWRVMLRRIDSKSPLSLEQDELELWARLSVEAGRKAMVNPFSQRLNSLDPTGKAALEFARAKRKHLRRKLQSSRINDHEVEELNNDHAQAFTDVKTVDIAMFEED